MGFFNIGGSSSKSKTTTEPWAPQGNLLKNFLYPQTQSLFGNTQAPGINPFQYQSAQYGADLFPMAQGIGNTFGSYGNSLAPNIDLAANYYRSTLGGDGISAPGLDWSIVDQAMNNPAIDGAIAASLRDPYRYLTEQARPGIASGAIGTGNMGGSRQAIAEGIANRGFDDRAADVSAAFRSDAYTQGLGLAQQNQQNRFNAGLFNAQQGNNAAQALAGLGTQGLGYLGDQYGFQQGAAQNLSGWGDYLQGLEFDQARFPWELLLNASNIIQANNWGGTSTSRGSQVGFGAQFGEK